MLCVGSEYKEKRVHAQNTNTDTGFWPLLSRFFFCYAAANFLSYEEIWLWFQRSFLHWLCLYFGRSLIEINYTQYVIEF